MKYCRFFIFVLILVLINQPSDILSQEFQWTKGFNQTANQDIDAFKTLLADRFSQRQNNVEEIFKEMRSASDTYMAFKLSEMSGRPVSDVVTTYETNKSKGWGKLAKELGIKPGSKEFHALKKQDDLYSGSYSETVGGKKKKDKKNGKKKAGKGKKNKLEHSKKEKKENLDEGVIENVPEKRTVEKENKKRWWNLFD